MKVYRESFQHDGDGNRYVINGSQNAVIVSEGDNYVEVGFGNRVVVLQPDGTPRVGIVWYEAPEMGGES